MPETVTPKEERKTATKVLVTAWIVTGILLLIRGIVGLTQGVAYVSGGGYKTGPGTPGQVIFVGLLFLLSGGYSLWTLLKKNPIQPPQTTTGSSAPDRV